MPCRKRYEILPEIATANFLPGIPAGNNIAYSHTRRFRYILLNINFVPFHSPPSRNLMANRSVQPVNCNSNIVITCIVALAISRLNL